MNKIISVCFVILLSVSCTKEPIKNFATLSGKIENNTDSIITIYGQKTNPKTIKINDDGSFKDTIKVTDASIYTFLINPTKKAPIYLKNGYDLQIKVNSDAADFMSNFSINGNGSNNTKLIFAQIEKSKSIGNPQIILNLEKDAFTKKVETLKQEYDSILHSYSDIDSTLISLANQQTTQMVSYFENTYARNLASAKGNPSPKFVDYVDFKGGKKSLDSFKGKFVYIDVWATWCGPCIQQIPYLQALEKEYHNKNIEFVSISTDENTRSGGSWEAAEKKWRDFVKEKQMTGVQLWSGQDFSFQQAYSINGIPRFILIDPNGNIVDANAPRPSEPRLKELFSSLGI